MLIDVRLTHLIADNYLIDMFDNNQEKIKLYQAMDSIKNRFGGSYIRRASGRIGQQHSRP